jgi:hypothetical protein
MLFRPLAPTYFPRAKTLVSEYFCPASLTGMRRVASGSNFA